jgi:hypothetical protein
MSNSKPDNVLDLKNKKGAKNLYSFKASVSQFVGVIVKTPMLSPILPDRADHSALTLVFGTCFDLFLHRLKTLCAIRRAINKMKN